MLVEFRVKNFRSFADEVFIQFDAEKTLHNYSDNLIATPKGNFVKTAAVYGANASGKSNLMTAVRVFRNFVLSSGKNNSTDVIPVEPFLLDNALVASPTLFEVKLLIDDVFYRYGYEITSKEVVSEWLFLSNKIEDEGRWIFVREKDKVEYSEFYFEEKGFERNLLPNTLLISRLDQMNVGLAIKVLRAVSKIFVFEGLQDQQLHDYTVNALRTESRKSDVISLARLADSDIADMYPLENSNDVAVVKKKFGSSNDTVSLSLQFHESAGTQKIFNFAGALMDVLYNGYIAFIDEFEAKLHPLLTRYLVMIFNSEKINKKGAQLIFVTHDTNLLAYGGLRRDQVWFCEKDKRGCSTLYSLVEIKDLQSDNTASSIEQNYIEGRYGAIPFFGGNPLLKVLADSVDRKDF